MKRMGEVCVVRVYVSHQMYTRSNSSTRMQYISDAVFRFLITVHTRYIGVLCFNDIAKYAGIRARTLTHTHALALFARVWFLPRLGIRCYTFTFSRFHVPIGANLEVNYGDHLCVVSRI